MDIIPPMPITPANAALVSSTVSEPDSTVGEVAWNSGTTYSTLGTEVTYQGFIYSNINITGNTNKPPLTNQVTFWKQQRPTNRYTMFALDRNTKTTKSSGNLKVVIAPNQRCDSIALLGVDSTSVLIEVKNSLGTVVFSYYEDLTKRNTTGWYSYYYGKFLNTPNVILHNLPPLLTVTIEVTITRGSNPSSIQALVLGMNENIGILEYSSNSDSRNFSTMDRKTDGTAVLNPKRTVPTTNNKIAVPIAKIPQVRRLRDTLNAVPAVYSGLDDQVENGYFELFLILGFYKGWKITPDDISYATLDLPLEEV